MEHDDDWEWSVLDDDGWHHVDAHTYFAEWLDERRAKSDEFRVALERLETEGCDRTRVGFLLSALEGSLSWPNLNREEVQTASIDLGRAADAIRHLFFSQMGRVLPLYELRLAGELRALSERAAELAPHVDKRSPMGRDAARAALVYYVQQKTGQFHDDDVSALIDSIESESRDKDKAAYSAAAHTQWRNREEPKRLLDGPSKEVQLLLTEMTRQVDGRQ